MEEKSAIRSGFIRFPNQTLGQQRRCRGTETTRSWESLHHSAEGKKGAAYSCSAIATTAERTNHSNAHNHTRPLVITRSALPFDQVTSSRRRPVGFVAAIILSVSGNRQP